MTRRIILLTVACVLLIGLSLSGCGPAGDQVVTFPDPNLANLTSLTELLLSYNQIGDISPLANANLTSLRHLDLSDNQIVDISPLVNNSGLSHLDGVCLWRNPLSSTSIDAHIPELRAWGVLVEY